jgi:hypothetical protein
MLIPFALASVEGSSDMRGHSACSLPLALGDAVYIIWPVSKLSG